MKKIIYLLAAVTLFAAGCDKNDGGKDKEVPEFVMDDVRLAVVFAEDRNTADIKMFQVKFADAMPVTLDITIPGLTVTKTAAGETLTGDAIIPMMNGTIPFAQYTVTKLSGVVAESKLTLSMTLGEYPTTYSGTDAAGDGIYIGTVSVW